MLVLETDSLIWVKINHSTIAVPAPLLDFSLGWLRHASNPHATIGVAGTFRCVLLHHDQAQGGFHCWIVECGPHDDLVRALHLAVVLCQIPISQARSKLYILLKQFQPQNAGDD